MFILKFITYCLLAIVAVADAQLKMVIEVFRHGARQGTSDLFWFPKQFTNPGELTSVGMRQHYNLGQILRKRYIEELNFLPENYSVTDLYVRSTDVNRTLMSAESQLLGLYPLGTGELLPNNINESLLQAPFFNATLLDSNLGNQALPQQYQPIPIHTHSPLDYLLLSYDSSVCPNQANFLEENYYSEMFQKVNLEMQPTFEELSKLFNIPISNLNLFSTYLLVDTLIASIYAGIQLPYDFNTNPELWKNLTFIYQITWYLVGFNTEQQISVANSNMFQDILVSFQNAINGNQTFKWKMYSAHDYNIMSLLSGFNYSSYQCIYDQFMNQSSANQSVCHNEYPAFASNFLIELYADSSNSTNKTNPFVKILYNGVYQEMCGDSNSFECNFDTFSERLNNRILNSTYFAEVCGISNKNKSLLEKKLLSQ